MSKITITDLEVHFRVGVPDEERANPQRLLITAELEFDFQRAATSDDLTKTINYYEVSRHIMQLGEGRSWKLIEKLASDVADVVLQEFKPGAITVTVKKFIIPEAAHVSVTLTKRRD